jgi:hypothetical protein
VFLRGFSFMYLEKRPSGEHSPAHPGPPVAGTTEVDRAKLLRVNAGEVFAVPFIRAAGPKRTHLSTALSKTAPPLLSKSDPSILT